MKKKQLQIILKYNPAEDDEHCWIRTEDDILTFEEAMDSDGYEGYEEYAPDYTRTDAKHALSSGLIYVYSSKEIKPGIFVSASRMDAESYSSDGNVYEKCVDIDDVAWIDALQGQYAPVRDEMDGLFDMPENTYDRGWQIPIRKKRFNEIISTNPIESADGRYVLYIQRHHMYFVDKKKKTCLLDALYAFLRDSNCDDDAIYAVIPYATMNKDEERISDNDYIDVFMDLMC